MANPVQKKMLLAVDGSECALDAVRYVGKFKPFHQMKVVLLNVFSAVPEAYYDLERDPQFYKAAKEIRSWEAQKKKEIREYMETCRQTLIRLGFPEKQIVVEIKNRSKGIARDIIRRARYGYDAVVVGRKGTGTYKEIIIGSVATKVVEKISFTPVLLIGQIPPDDNILLAVDGSESSNRTVDYVAATLGGYDYKIHLRHVIRSTTGIGGFVLGKTDMKEARKYCEGVFAADTERLLKAGFQKNQITTKIIEDAHSRAGAIIAEARTQDYGTIVVGRRGLSRVKEFFMGRVSNKIIHTVRNRAVWVVT